MIHIGEGVDQTRAERVLQARTRHDRDGCLLAPETTIVHGTAFGDAEFTTMAADDMSLVWSPRSNVFLYGNGTDLSKTTNIPLARSKGINVALATRLVDRRQPEPARRAPVREVGRPDAMGRHLTSKISR